MLMGANCRSVWTALLTGEAGEADIWFLGRVLVFFTSSLARPAHVRWLKSFAIRLVDSLTKLVLRP